MPIRIQRKRTKGWRMPEGAVYVGRNGQQSVGEFGNPFKVGGWFMIGDPDPRARLRMSWCQSYVPNQPGFTLISDRQMAVDWYRKYRRQYPLSKASIDKIRGRDLACWCALDQPCHADVLLEIANA